MMNTIDLPVIDLSNIMLASIVNPSDPNVRAIIAPIVETSSLNRINTLNEYCQ